MAHILKWMMYSSFVIPPFPTSSMSGSVSNKSLNLIISVISIKRSHMLRDE